MSVTRGPAGRFGGLEGIASHRGAGSDTVRKRPWLCLVGAAQRCADERWCTWRVSLRSVTALRLPTDTADAVIFGMLDSRLSEGVQQPAQSDN